MMFNWRTWNRVLHRDLGFFFFGMTIIYSLSGIALNHIHDWNPSYQISTQEVTWPYQDNSGQISQDNILAFLDTHGEKENYKKHYQPQASQLRIFIKDGNVIIDLNTRQGIIEKLNRRPFFYHVNYLHYNPGRLWSYFSDFFCISLVLIAISGLFIIRGKKGIKGRGAILTAIGMLLPILFLFIK